MRKHLVLPTPATLRHYRFLVRVGLGVIAFLFVAFVAIGTGSGGSGRSPLPLLVLALGQVGMIVRWRSIAARLSQQIAQLSSYGRRFPAELAQVEPAPRDLGKGLNLVIARWRDAAGVAREACSEAFDYDPAPLLERDRIEVLADPFHPELCLVAPDSLPPCHYRELARARPEAGSRLAPRPRFLRSVPPWIPTLFVLLVVAFLVWALR